MSCSSAADTVRAVRSSQSLAGFAVFAGVVALAACGHLLSAEVLESLRGLPWLDMCKLFVDSRLAVHGSFDYKLKHVARALYARGGIAHTWPDGEIENGLHAMQHARELYSMGRTRKRTRDGLSAIRRYNETDTAVLFDIVQLVVRQLLGA